MKTLLLAGYRHDENLNDAPGLQTDANGVLRLNRRIDQLHALGHHVTCVLSGAAADPQIRRARKLEDVDIAYDTSDRVSLMSNVRAGLAAVGPGPCFCLPVEIPWPSDASWSTLTRVAASEPARASFAQLIKAGEALDFGFPLLITRRGGAEIARLPDLTSLADPRLEYLYLNL